MVPEEQQTDRYISFCGIACDANADKLVAILEKHLNSQHGGSEWVNYFQQKRAEQARMGGDNLHFIGNQLNPLFEYFQACSDDDADALLYQIEQECL